MNILQKATAWAFSKAMGFPPWTTGNWPNGLKIGSDTSTDAGISVNGPGALAISAIWACVRIRSQMLGSFPVVVFRKGPNGTKVLEDHDLYTVLHDSPNQYMTSMEWRQCMSVAFDLYGNAFSEIKRMGARVVSLNPLQSDHMQIVQDNGNLTYRYKWPKTSKQTEFKPDDILHLRNFSLDGIVGLNPIEQQRHSIGLGLAQQRYGSALYKNGGRPAGVLEHPAKLDKPAVTRLRESWEAIHAGAENGGKVAILWEGMKYNAVGLSPMDQQFIESRKFQLDEYARIYGVQPHLIGNLDRSTNNNIEQQGIEAVIYGFAPTCELWEQRIKKSLLNRPGTDNGVYAKFSLDALMRGDSIARAAFYSSMTQNGIMTRDECRDSENLPRMGGAAAELTVQSNMTELDLLGKLVAARLMPPAPPAGPPAALPPAKPKPVPPQLTDGGKP